MKLNVLFTVGIVSICTLSFGQTRAELASWHNLPITHIKSGGHAWTREFDALGRVGDWGFLALGSRVVVRTPGKLTALDSANGGTLWSRQAPIHPSAFPNGESQGVEIGKRMVFWENADSKCRMVALESRTGKTAWTTTLPGHVLNLQVAGHRLYCELVAAPWSPTAAFKCMVLVDGDKGNVVAELSPSDESTNRAILRKVCPELIDQLVIFGSNVSRNGVYPFAEGYPQFLPESWVLDGSIYRRIQVEDYPMDLGELSASCGLTKHSSDQELAGPDQWAGKAMGRRYYSQSCNYYGPLLGTYQGKLLTTYTRQTATPSLVKKYETLVTLPMTGSPVSTPIETPLPVAGLLPSGRTASGFYLYATDSRGAFDRVMLLDSSGIRLLPKVREELPTGFGNWELACGCSNGLLYFARTDLALDSGRQLIHLEPLPTR